MSELQTVLFTLKGQLFGADAAQVLNITKYLDAKKEPELPGFLEGTVNIQGRVVPLISMNRRFGMGQPESGAKILILSINDMHVGFIVDNVIEILHLPDDDIENIPEILKAKTKEYLVKVARRDNSLFSIIDFTKVLTDAELESLKSIA